METLEQITTENLTHLKNTYRDIGAFYLSQGMGDGLISEKFLNLANLYRKRARNLDRLFEDGSFRGENSYNVVFHDLEVAYYNTMNFEHDQLILPSIHETINMIDKVSVKN